MENESLLPNLLACCDQILDYRRIVSVFLDGEVSPLAVVRGVLEPGYPGVLALLEVRQDVVVGPALVAQRSPRVVIPPVPSDVQHPVDGT